MSDSIFGDLDIEGASDDPFGVPVGVHPVQVTDVKVIRPKADDKDMLLLEYKVTDGDATGNTVQERKTIKTDGEDANSPSARRNASFLKIRLKELGVPEARLNSVKPDDLIGVEGFLTIGEPNNGYTNVKSFSLHNPENVQDAAQAAVDSNPFATTGT